MIKLVRLNSFTTFFMLFSYLKVKNYKKFSIFGKFLAIYEKKSNVLSNIYIEGLKS